MFLVGAASLGPSELARFCHLQDGDATAPIILKRAECRAVSKQRRRKQTRVQVGNSQS